MDAPTLIADLHRELTIQLSHELNLPLQGLAQGARLLRGRLSSATCRRLRDLDAAFGFVRHITPQHNKSFLAKVMTELDNSFVPVATQAPPAEFYIGSSASSTTSDDNVGEDLELSSSSSVGLSSPACDDIRATDHDFVHDPETTMTRLVNTACAGLVASLRLRRDELAGVFAAAMAAPPSGVQPIARAARVDFMKVETHDFDFHIERLRAASSHAFACVLRLRYAAAVADVCASDALEDLGDLAPSFAASCVIDIPVDFHMVDSHELATVLNNIKMTTHFIIFADVGTSLSRHMARSSIIDWAFMNRLPPRPFSAWFDVMIEHLEVVSCLDMVDKFYSYDFG